jgi:hypothetical protein
VRIPCVIEWRGSEGWHAAAEYRGRTVSVARQRSLSLARKRLSAALSSAGAPDPELQIVARMPKAVEDDLARYRELGALIPKLTAERRALQLQVAQRLAQELHFSEREVAGLLGVSGTLISAKLRAHATDTGEFLRPSAAGEHEDEEDDEV